MRIQAYRGKRDFNRTREPRGRLRPVSRVQPVFVIQEHHARRLHFDFRLEVGGVLKSWAVTREPSMDPIVRRLAVETEDHPIEYAKFEGEIPQGEYGAGSVQIWDHGSYDVEGDLMKSYDAGKIVVTLHGTRLRGRFALIRFQGSGERSNWLFFKTKPEPKELVIHRDRKRRR